MATQNVINTGSRSAGCLPLIEHGQGLLRGAVADAKPGECRESGNTGLESDMRDERTHLSHIHRHAAVRNDLSIAAGLLHLSCHPG